MLGSHQDAPRAPPSLPVHAHYNTWSSQRSRQITGQKRCSITALSQERTKAPLMLPRQTSVYFEGGTTVVCAHSDGFEMWVQMLVKNCSTYLGFCIFTKGYQSLVTILTF